MSTPFDLKEVVEELATGTYNVERPTLTYDNEGRLNAPSLAVFTVIASVTPASGRDMLRLPEGSREIDAIAILTTTELKNDDVFSYNGRTYVVGHVDPWFAGFWKAVAVNT